MFGKNFFYFQSISIDWFWRIHEKNDDDDNRTKIQKTKVKNQDAPRKKNRKHLKNGLNSMKKEWKIHKVEHIMFVEFEKWKKKQNLKTRISLSDSSNVSGTIVASILN